MLMTNGIGVPGDPAEQASYLGRLADAGISAIAVGEDVGAPPISDAMTAASERRALPLLVTAFEVPFAAVARVVAEAKTDVSERRRLLKTARIYESLRTATIEGRDATSLFTDLGTELGCSLEALDISSWRYAFAPRRPLVRAVRPILSDTLARCAGHLPAILRLDLDGHAALAVPVSSRRPAALLASRFTDSAPELSVLQHASTVAALELEKLVSERDGRSRAGAELFAELLSARLDPKQALARLGAEQLPDGELVVAAWWPGPAATERTAVHQDLYARGVAHLLLVRDENWIALALIGGDRGSLAMLLDTLPEDHAVGLSGPVTGCEGIPNAAREARWALHTATPEDHTPSATARAVQRPGASRSSARRSWSSTFSARSCVTTGPIRPNWC
jgi:purine catabolism regulator